MDTKKKERRNLVIIIAVSFILPLMISVVLTGCSCEKGDRESKEIVKDEDRYQSFIILSSEVLSGPGYLEQYIMYDPQTKIMWTYIEESNGGGLSIIYNVDGTPMLYEP